MKSKLSPHARALFRSIIQTIVQKQSVDDGLQWQTKIEDAVLTLEDFPEIGTGVPLKCFETIPPNADELRQTFCRPYRIVYEVVGDEIHILSIRHSRMLVTGTDTYWN